MLKTNQKTNQTRLWDSLMDMAKIGPGVAVAIVKSAVLGGIPEEVLGIGVCSEGINGVENQILIPLQFGPQVVHPGIEGHVIEVIGTLV